jgi:hypothetical protein
MVTPTFQMNVKWSFPQQNSGMSTDELNELLRLVLKVAKYNKTSI